MTVRNITAAIALALATTAVQAQHDRDLEAPSPAIPLTAANDPFRPYEFLIGDWISQEGSSALRQSFRWGPSRSYILYSTYMRQPGSPERLHFEGIMVWNGKTKALDFLFAVEPGSWVQEKGFVRAEPDGSIVREVELTSASGGVTLFRQTIKRTDADRAVTSLMTLKGGRWEPNFPGADMIEMKRRAS